VKYISYDDSKGACYARNLAINIAKGKYITGLDDDDLFSEGRLSELFENRGLLETYSFISTGTLFIKNGKKVKTQFSDKAVIDREAIVRGNAIGNQVFTLSERLKNINGFDVSLLCWQDYDAWIRLIFEYGSGYNLQSPTYIMNIDERKDRISLSKKKTSGIKVFLEKHSMCLTPRFKGKFKAFICLFGDEGVSFSGVKERAFFKLYLFLYKIKNREIIRCE
ncbi:glycosyltransferase, partial [Salinivibrio sp. IB643]|uniref:glycosyltransferase n=1 Tax=Salinivibrio sp. IB643 TaxID=1909445 RepID=UPI0009C830FD